MSLYDEKQKLFEDYIKELEIYKGAPIYRNNDDISRGCDAYMCSTDASWKNIHTDDGKTLAGFLIIGKSGTEKHPDSDFSIAEAYITPTFRHKGLMSGSVQDYVGRHPGTYSLLVYKRNRYALQYWNDIFACIGYTPVSLPEIDLGPMSRYVEQLAFQPRS